MKKSRRRTQRSALGALDLLFAMAMVALISIIAVAKASAQARSSSRIACLNNLRQIGIAFRMWANGHQNRFPWQVPPKRGTWEWAETTQTLRHFHIASNELDAPGTVDCPAD